jgi:hypothetical protein
MQRRALCTTLSSKNEHVQLGAGSGEWLQSVITELQNVETEGYDVMMKSKGRKKGYKTSRGV